MAYHDDLLQQAFDLVAKNPDSPTQAALRRAVSGAYYALFHLLIHETVTHWSLDSSRDGLARMFEHRVMGSASKNIRNPSLFPFTGKSPNVVICLRTIAASFNRLQDNRHLADYDNSTLWTHTEALEEVAIAATAFSLWHAIKSEKIAQDYLVSLLVRPPVLAPTAFHMENASASPEFQHVSSVTLL